MVGVGRSDPRAVNVLRQNCGGQPTAGRVVVIGVDALVERVAMTIVIVAFRDDPGRAVAYKKFTDIEEAVSFYHGLLEQARFKTGKQKPRIISTRIILP